MIEESLSCQYYQFRVGGENKISCSFCLFIITECAPLSHRSCCGFVKVSVDVIGFSQVGVTVNAKILGFVWHKFKTLNREKLDLW